MFPFSRHRGASSVETSMLRAATLATAVCWPFLMIEAITRCFPPGTFFGHWFPPVSAALFISAIVGLFIAFFSGDRRWLVLALKYAAVTLPVVMLLVFLRPYDGTPATGPGMWFAGFSGAPAVAMALVSPIRAAIPYWAIGVGGTALMNSVYEGRTDVIDMVGEVGFGLVYVFPLVMMGVGTMAVSRLIDRTESEALNGEIRAARLRARSAEISRFTGLVHDFILTLLAGIAAGIKPSEPLDLRFSAAYGNAARVPVDQTLEALNRSLRQHLPDCPVQVEKDAGSLPGSVVAASVMAVAEAAKNSAKHGGDARRNCRITLSDGHLSVLLRDDGPGFDMSDIRPDAAGVRVSIIGRMDGIGGTGEVTSAPGDGTTVALEWTGDESGDIPEMTSSAAPSSQPAPLQVFELMRMGSVYSWGFGASIAAVFAVMATANHRPFTTGTMLTYATLIALLAVIFPGRRHPLPGYRAIAAVFLMILLAHFGMWQDLSESAIWSHHWHLNALALAGSLLALKGRPWAAAVAVVAAAVTVEGIGTVWEPPNSEISGVQVVASCIIVLGSALVNIGVRYFVGRLPAAQRSLRTAQRDAAAAAEMEDRRRLNLKRLEGEVLPVFEAVTRGETIDPTVRKQAGLTDLKLRDAIRSPLLDSPDLRDEAWRARERGITVQFLDDRSGSTRDRLTSPATFLHDRDRIEPGLKASIIEALRIASTGKVTVRLLPAGRSAFATISDESGVRRFSEDGIMLG